MSEQREGGGVNTAPNSEPMYRCQFCGRESPAVEWDGMGDACPQCGRLYDWMLAQDEETE